MDQGRNFGVWCTICLILCGQCLTKDGTKNNYDEDGAVEVEDAEGVLQQLDEALDSGIISETELTHTLKKTFKISEKEWRVIVEQHDADGDGKLAADELLSVAEYLTNKHGEWPIQEKQPLNGAQTGLYVIIGIILFYVIYTGWKHRQENAGIVHGPDESALREARLAVLSRGRSSSEERIRNLNQQNTVSSKGELRQAMNRDEQALRRRRFGDDNDCQDPAKKRHLVDKRHDPDDIHLHLSGQDSKHCENEATTNQKEDTSANNSNTEANLYANSENTIVKTESLSTTTSDASLDVSPSSSPPQETTIPKNKSTVSSTTSDVSPSSIPSSERTQTEKSNSNRPTKLDGISGKTSIKPLSETAQTGKSNSNGHTKLDGVSGETLFKQESMSTTTSGASSSDVSPTLSPSSEKKTIKKPSPPKPDAPRKDAHPDITGDDLFLYILSKLFNLKVEIRKSGVKTGWTPGTMSIKVTDLPSRVEDVHMKMFVLFERRLSRHYSSKVKFCVSCFYNCLDLKGYYADEIVNKMISSASSLCISTILQQLQEEEEETNEEDDLYSDLGHTSESFEKMEIVSFLLRVAGWSDDGVNISLDLLNEIVTYATKNENATQAMAKVLKSAGNVLKSVQRLDELQLMHGKTLKGLEHLLSQPALPEVLNKILDHELDQSSSSLGIYFQRQSVLGSLLSITTIPPSLVEGTKMNSSSLQPWITLRGFPQRPNYDELKNLENRMQEQLHIIQQLVFNVLKRMMKSNRETALAWLATLINMNEMRTSVTPQIQPVASHSIQAACSDSYMLNICAVLIELCIPFCKGDVTKLDKIDASYSASSACRLNYDFETCLAGGQIVQEGDSKTSTSGRLPESLRGRFNFMTEILHLTVRAMNVGFLPAKNHYSKLQQQLMYSLKAVSGNKSAEADIRAKHLAFSLQWETHLMDPEILRKGSELYLTVAIWLQLQLEKAAKGAKGDVETEKRQRKIFSQIPEHCVKDMAQWFWFIASHGLMVHPRALAGLQLAPFVDVCVYLLRRPDLVPGPIPAYRITQALLAFVSTSNRNREQQRGWGSGVISELAAMVHACPTVQEYLGPALLHNYISVDVVEGLDVDKEDFDKYSARAEIARLLQNLWERLDCRSSVLNLCGSEKFQSFLGAIIDTLLYQLHDSLARLANVRKLERSREDEAAWNALSYKEQEASETFRKNEGRVATGFMSMARETLGLIDLISKSEEVARCFTVMPLARRAASTFIGFLESLCGSKSATFKVKDMEKYRFNPRELLSQIAQILLRIMHEERARELHFVKSMAADPDYSPATMQKACDTLRSKNILDETAVKEFETLNEEVSILREAIQTESSSPSSGPDDDWQSVIDKQQIDETELENSYTEEMGDLRFDSAELQDNHCYQSNATHVLDARSRQAKALIKEMKQWAEILPVHPHAAVFVRQDEERMDMVRALVTGPRDTPYSLGCFVFDIYFPSQYPNIPPLVKFTTTGNGTVRFNPNLYADGKVCLSLLGTFYSGDSSQKWLPNTSSLYQVMVSIQSMILIPDPMYNEPGYEGMRDTQEGEARSREYNARLRLMTIRHAMLGQLRNPPVGFEEVIRKHFRLQYKAVLKQCSQWLRESEAEDEERKLRRVIDELRSELKKLTDDDNTENTEHQDEGDN